MLYPCEHVPKTSLIERIVSGDFWFLYWEGLERGMLGLQSIKSFPDTDYRLIKKEQALPADRISAVQQEKGCKKVIS